MATKLTAAQKRAKINLENDKYEKAQWDDFIERYQIRFATLIYNYFSNQHEGFTVNRKDNDVYDFTSSSWNNVVTIKAKLSLADIEAGYNYEDIENFEHAEKPLEDLAKVKALQKEIEIQRNAALSKLTRKEQELLGLKSYD